MKLLTVFSLLILSACNLSSTGKGANKNHIEAIPTVVEVVTESFTVKKTDNIALAAYSSKAITPTHIKVVKELTKDEVAFRISKLPLQGMLLLDNLPVILNQDIKQSDLNRGAFKYQHTLLPGADAFEFIAWNKESMSVVNKFNLIVKNPLERACNDNNGQGTQVWDTVDYAECKLTSCDQDFYFDNGECLPQICTPNVAQSCSILNGTGSETCNALGSAFSSCSLGACDAGYHVRGSVCELDVAPCTITNGSGTQTWVGSTYGLCTVTTCNNGFYQSGNTCLPQICAPNSIAACTISNGSGTSQCSANGSALSQCSVQTCSAGYQISGNTCTAIPVTCSYPAVAGPVYDRSTVNIGVPTTQGYNLQYRLTPSVSGVTLNTNGSLVVVTQEANFNFSVEAYSATGSAQCPVAFTVTKSLIANANSKTTMQGQAISIPVAELLANDSSLAGRAFSLTSVGAAIGGSVSLLSGAVSFNPTGMSGDSASFEYTITDSAGATAKAVVTMTISPLPRLDALIYDQNEMTEMMALLNTAPPTMQNVFDSWERFEDQTYYANKAAASGEALSWDFKTNPDRVESNFNSTKYIGFVSPEKLDNYVLQTDISSTDTDDDAITVLISFVRKNGVNYSLSLVRTQGGTITGVMQGFALVYNLKQADQVIIAEKNVGGVYQNKTKTGWSGRSSRVKVSRNENAIKIWASTWSDVVLDPNSLISLDLNSDPRLDVFKGKQSYGFGAYSQKNSTFKNITLEGGSNLNNNTVYDMANQQIWVYTPGVGWALSTDDFAESLGYPRELYNPNTNKYYTIDRNGNVTPVSP